MEFTRDMRIQWSVYESSNQQRKYAEYLHQILLTHQWIFLLEILYIPDIVNEICNRTCVVTVRCVVQEIPSTKNLRVQMEWKCLLPKTVMSPPSPSGIQTSDIFSATGRSLSITELSDYSNEALNWSGNFPTLLVRLLPLASKNRVTVIN
jgi:hypothetical protein